MDVKIPKFRTSNGLVNWIMKNNWRSRLSPDREEVFFRSRESQAKKAWLVARYADHVGCLDSKIEALLVHDPASVVDYAIIVHKKGHELSDEILSALIGRPKLLIRLARYTKRLPQWLEDSIDDPKFLVEYARSILRGRLPPHLEERLMDRDAAVKYAFDVIRGCSSVRLPPLLHTFLTMKSFEDTENQSIKNYFGEIRNEKIPETSDAEV